MTSVDAPCCACGCGGLVRKGKTWLKGHCNKGRPRPDARLRMKNGGSIKALRAQWGEPRPPYWGAFQQHIWRAQRQRIGFELTYDQWIAIWTESGHLNQRGTHHGLDGYCMARFGDEGSYAVENVRIITNRENLAERDTEKMSLGCLGNTNGAGVRGLIWITDGKSNRRIRDISSKPKGWVRGVTQQGTTYESK